MDTIQTALKLMRPGCFMASVDLKFEWPGSYFQYTCLPNGPGCALRVFTKTLKPVYSHIRSLGHICMGHIDDSFLVGYNYTVCER